MKKLLVAGLMFTITLLFTGCSNSVDVETATEVTSAVVNSQGIQLNYSDGSGYWIESSDVQKGSGISMKQAIETYGEKFEVIELSKTEFLVVWDNAKLVFNNNVCVGYISLR